VLPAKALSVAEYYKSADVWPKNSLERRNAALAAKPGG